VRVLGFGTYDVRRHPRAGILLDGLGARGIDVEQLNQPLGFSTAERIAMVERPWLGYRFAFRLLRRWATLALRARRTRAIDAVLVGYLAHFDVILARLLFPRTRIVLDQMIFAADTARDRGVAGGWKLRLLRLLDRIAVACADIVVVDTEEHAALIPKSESAKGVVVPVGALDEWFSAPPAGVGDGPLRVVFFGLFTPLQGTKTIGDALALIADRADIAVTMIGTGQDYAATRQAASPNPNVTWVEWVEPHELPVIVSAHDVCLGIFAATAKGQRVVPNKVYEGAASGCAILTSDTAPQRRTLGDDAILVKPGDAQALADALVRLADDRSQVLALRTAAWSRANQCFRSAAVVEPLVAALDMRQC
jgi:glycosyltransferase involved in cell wall biosynthesis